MSGVGETARDSVLQLGRMLYVQRKERNGLLQILRTYSSSTQQMVTKYFHLSIEQKIVIR